MKGAGAIPTGYRLALWVYAAIFYGLLYGPLIMIAVLSFNRSNIIGFPIRGMGLIWYEKVLRTPEFLAAFVQLVLLCVSRWASAESFRSRPQFSISFSRQS